MGRTWRCTGALALASTLLIPTAHAQSLPPSITVDPTHGAPGAPFQVRGQRFIDCLIQIRFNGVLLGTTTASKGAFTFSTNVPKDAKPGDARVTASDCQGQSDTRTFTVDEPPTTTSPTTTTTSTTTTTTAPGSTTTSTTPGATTTTGRATTTTSTTSTTSTTVPAETTPTIGPETTVEGLVLDRPSAEPGGRVHAEGRGCDPDAPVAVSLDGDDVAETTADAQGDFEVPITLREVEVGRHRVEARCGPTLRTTLDVVLASQIDTGSSSLAVFLFFLLLALALIRRRATN